jgi:hypothetical protein
MVSTLAFWTPIHIDKSYDLDIPFEYKRNNPCVGEI